MLQPCNVLYARQLNKGSGMQTAQREFDATYISVSEICDRLKINRSSVMHAKKKGCLPNAVDVCHGTITLWRRAEVAEYLDAWERVLMSKRELAEKVQQ